MKKRKIVMTALLAAAVSCFACFGMITAQAATEQGAFGFKAGASVRYEEHTGLRFTVELSGEKYAELVENGTYRDGKSMKVYIAPSEYFEKAGTDLDAVAAKAAIAEIKAETFYAEGANYCANAVLSDVLYRNTGREFSAVAAIESAGVREYGEVSDARSIAYVSSAALADETAEYTEEQKSLMNTFVQKAIANAKGVAEADFVADGSYGVEIGMETSLSLQPEESAALNAAITPAIGLYTEYASDNEEVATVDANGNVTAVGEGTATVTATVYGKTATCAVTVGDYAIGVEDFTAVQVDFTTLDGSAEIVCDTFTVGGKTGEFFKWSSTAYQPFLKICGDRYAALKAYCATKGYNALKVTAFPVLTDNMLVLGGGDEAVTAANKVWYKLNQWTTSVISVEDFAGVYLWSQSTGTTEVYFTVEPCMEYLQYFENLNASAPYSLSIAADKGEYTKGNQFVYTLSGNAYRPTATMNAAGIAKIKEFAERNGYNTLRVFNTALNDNAAFGYLNDDPALYNTDGTAGWGMDKTIAISDLAGLAFWITAIDSPVTVDIVMEFSYVKTPVVSASDFENPFTDRPFALNYIGSKGDYTAKNQFVYSFGGSSYQPTAKLSAEGIAKIKAFAEANGYNTLRCFVYTAAADDFSTFGYFNESLTGYNTNGAENTWHIDKSVAISELTAFSFWTSKQNESVSVEFVLEFLTK